jgi:predicted transporter
MYKPLIFVIIGLVLFGGGLLTGFKLQKDVVVKCPDLIETPCPACPPSVEVQSLDLDGIRMIKGNFTFSPIYNGDVYMVSDSIK